MQLATEVAGAQLSGWFVSTMEFVSVTVPSCPA
jgi:hypothetical protein